METISDIAREFGTQLAMANALGVSRGRVEQWCQRNSIPSAWLRRVVDAADRHGVDLSAEQLLNIIDRKDAA